jgi:hypothetical protein
MGNEFFAALQTGPGAHAAFCTRGNGSFPGIKRSRCGSDHAPHLAPRLKKEYSYSSTPLLGLRGLYKVNFTVDLYLYLLFHRLYVYLPVNIHTFGAPPADSRWSFCHCRLTGTLAVHSVRDEALPDISAAT